MFKKTFTAFIIAGLLIVQAQNKPKTATNKATPKAAAALKRQLNQLLKLQ